MEPALTAGFLLILRALRLAYRRRQVFRYIFGTESMTATIAKETAMHTHALNLRTLNCTCGNAILATAAIVLSTLLAPLPD